MSMIWESIVDGMAGWVCVRLGLLVVGRSVGTACGIPAVDGAVAAAEIAAIPPRAALKVDSACGAAVVVPQILRPRWGGNLMWLMAPGGPASMAVPSGSES